MKVAAKLGWSANQASFHDNLVAIYANLSRLACATLAHAGVWFIGVSEVLVALRLMGFPVSYGEALAIESVGQAVRAVGFLMPAALGVQEAGFIAVCAVYASASASSTRHSTFRIDHRNAAHAFTHNRPRGAKDDPRISQA